MDGVVLLAFAYSGGGHSGEWVCRGGTRGGGGGEGERGRGGKGGGRGGEGKEEKERGGGGGKRGRKGGGKKRESKIFELGGVEKKNRERRLL